MNNAATIPAPVPVQKRVPKAFLTLFSPRSPWRSKPVSPVFDDYVLPPSVNGWGAVIAGGPYSVTAYLARKTDKPTLVHSDNVGTVTLPRWPVGVTPASGDDGHADIIDVTGNRVHSFWRLRQADGQWFAGHYGAVTLSGSGWGDGARAAGVPAIAGVARLHELHDGKSLFEHALCMSLPFEALSADPTFVAPASRADTDAATTNTGRIPEGALMMLPPDFPVDDYAYSPMLQKFHRTLMTYGAWVTDRNYRTPFILYCEGPDYELVDYPAFDQIRQALRMVTACGWVDADGKAFKPSRKTSYLTLSNQPMPPVVPRAFDEAGRKSGVKEIKRA